MIDNPLPDQVMQEMDRVHHHLSQLHMVMCYQSFILPQILEYLKLNLFDHFQF